MMMYLKSNCALNLLQETRRVMEKSPIFPSVVLTLVFEIAKAKNSVFV